MRWNKNNLRIFSAVPNHRVQAIFDLARTCDATCLISRAGEAASSIEARGFNPAQQARIDRWARDGTPLDVINGIAPHYAGLPRTKFTIT